MTGAGAAADAAKTEMRAEARARREVGRPGWGWWLAGHVLRRCPPPPGAVVGGFWPMPGEIDVCPLLLALAARGHAVLLPETPPLGQPLRFRRWRPGAAMVAERFGTVRPDGPEGTPDWLLVPLLAFDARGNRLGYGGGYYDRTLALLPGARTVGCAFAAQQVEAVPCRRHDRPLDLVATERGILYPSRPMLVTPEET